MANKSIKDILDAIYTAISTNATLVAYVKSFRNNTPGVQTVFPAVWIASIRYSNAAVTHGANGRDNRSYTVEVVGAVKNMADDQAFYGTAVEKGAIHLCEDLADLIRVNDFGVFRSPVNITEAGVVVAQTSETGFITLARIVFTGDVWHTRNG